MEWLENIAESAFEDELDKIALKIPSIKKSILKKLKPKKENAFSARKLKNAAIGGLGGATVGAGITIAAATPFKILKNPKELIATGAPKTYRLMSNREAGKLIALPAAGFGAAGAMQGYRLPAKKKGLNLVKAKLRKYINKV